MNRNTHIYALLVILLFSTFAIAAPQGSGLTASEESRQQEIYRITRLARNAESAGDLEKSLNLWLAAINLEIDNNSAYRGIQRSLIGLARYDDAIAFLDSMYSYSQRGHSKLDPVIIAADRIDVLLLADENERADTEITRLLSEYKGSDKAYTEVASILFQHRKNERATQVILQGRKDTGNKLLYARDLARWYENQMDWNSAIEEYLLYLEDSNQRLNYVTGAIGDMPVEIRDDSIAEEIILNRIKATETDFSAQLRRLLASLYFKNKNYEQALQQYRLIDEHGEKSGQELLEFADLLMIEGEFKLAQSAYRELMSANLPEKMNVIAALGIGRTNLALGEVDSARAAFTSIIAPGNPNEAVFEAFEELGKLEIVHGGSPAKAREMFESALKIASRSRVPINHIDEVKVISATTWAMEGDLETAKKKLNDLLKSNRKVSNAVSMTLYELTRIAFWQGNTEELQQRSNALIIADPSSDYANDALAMTSLLADLKDNPSVIQSFGRADYAEFKGSTKTAEIILDSLLLDGNPLIVEEAFWRFYRLEIKRDSLDNALAYLDRIINLKGALRADLAVYTAGELIEKRMANPNLAAEYYEKILIDYPDSPLVEKARRRLRQIEKENS
jgi:tetratricopeptide (TPR) repeat protein